MCWASRLWLLALPSHVLNKGEDKGGISDCSLYNTRTGRESLSMTLLKVLEPRVMAFIIERKLIYSKYGLRRNYLSEPDIPCGSWKEHDTYYLFVLSCTLTTCWETVINEFKVKDKLRLMRVQILVP